MAEAQQVCEEAKVALSKAAKKRNRRNKAKSISLASQSQDVPATSRKVWVSLCGMLLSSFILSAGEQSSSFPLTRMCVCLPHFIIII